MAIESYFFNAILDGQGGYDRTYNSDDFTSYLELLVGDGVFPTPSMQLQVTSNSTMGVRVRAGQGWIQGHKLVNTADLALEIEASDVLLDRIDAIIMYCDWINREMGIEVKKGSASSSPYAPSLVRNAGTRYELCLAQVSVPKQTTTITANLITDTRGNSNLCGWVAGLIQQIDTTGLWQQWDSDFNDWFDQVKDTLATATLLQKLEQVFTTDATVTSFDVVEYIPSYKYTIDILEIYVNGLRLDDNEYSMSQSTVTLAAPITHTGTEISLVVYKSIDGSDAETIVEQVQELQSTVDTIETGVYIATGDDDNKKLSQIVQDFLGGTSDYRQLELDVYGDLGCSEPAATVGGTQYWFDFSATSSTRRVKLNFAHASRITVSNTGISNATLIRAAGTEIANLQAVMNNCTTATMIENDSTCTDCAFWMTGTGAGTLIGALEGTFTRCRFSVTNNTGKAYGFSANGGVLKLTDVEALAYNRSSATSNESVGVQVQGNQTNNVLIMTNCSCPIKARTGYKQDNVVKVNSGFYCLTGNMLGEAALLYSTGDGKTETGTMIVSK